MFVSQAYQSLSLIHLGIVPAWPNPPTTMWSSLLYLVALAPFAVRSLAPTDEIQDADSAQSGYLDNHNMDPAIVGSSSFGILWKNTYGSKEKWYTKPLVYTPPGASQLVFTASAMNIVRTLDAVNGTLLSSRTVQPPFLQSDIGIIISACSPIQILFRDC